MFVTIIGFLALTALLLWPTLWFASMVFLQWGFAGFHVLDWKDWLILVSILAVLVVLWTLWWLYVGSSVSISVSYN